MRSDHWLNGKTAVITGAAGGLGRALAEAAAVAGANVELVDIDRTGLETTAAQIGKRGGRCQSLVADLGSVRDIEHLAAAVAERHRQVDLLINNAGFCISGDLLAQSPEEIERITRVNQMAVVYGCRAFAPLLMKSRRAQVVNISSALGLIGAASQTTYSMTKFAVRGFSEALRSEWRALGIGVTTVFPGAINSNIVRNTVQAEPLSAAEQRFVQRYFEVWGISTAKAATKILRGASRNAARVRITSEAFLIDWAARLMPGGLQYLAAWSRDVYRRRWRGAR